MTIDMLYHFPRAVFVDQNNISGQLIHIQQEVEEAFAETGKRDLQPLALEVMDIYHSAETALRILQEKHGVDIRALMHQTAEKNDARGYYNADN